jgi:hypothetical protein
MELQVCGRLAALHDMIDNTTSLLCRSSAADGLEWGEIAFILFFSDAFEILVFYFPAA